jgi:thiamine kinase-like enzyme
MTPLDKVHSLPIWRGPITASRLGGGITNVNYLVADQDRQVVVRIGDDIPVHQILRFNELSASRAAYAAGVSPAVLHHQPGALVIDFVRGRTLTAEDIRAPQNFDRVIDLVARAHRSIPQHLRGPVLMFWVFHVLRDYAATLADGASRHLATVPALLEQATELERAVGPVDLVFGHNDLLPANFLDDGTRLWLIDWDYAGFNSPLFDLGGLAANNGLTPDHEAHMLQRYFGTPPDAALWRRYRAMKAASALREAMWSMVQEIHSDLDFDYAAYTADNLDIYRAAFAAYRES